MQAWFGLLLKVCQYTRILKSRAETGNYTSKTTKHPFIILENGIQTISTTISCRYSTGLAPIFLLHLMMVLKLTYEQKAFAAFDIHILKREC